MLTNYKSPGVRQGKASPEWTCWTENEWEAVKILLQFLNQHKNEYRGKNEMIRMK